MAVSPHPPRLPHRVGVIGAGRVGAVLAAALRRAGHEVVAVSGDSSTSRARIDTLLPGLSAVSPEEVATTGDLLLLTVPDDRLAPLVARLVASGWLREGQVVVHTSGRHGHAVLLPAAEQGAVTVALHPAMTFTGTKADLARLPGCVFGLTAGIAGRELGAQLAEVLGGSAVVVPEEQRTLYHAALAHGANHLVTLVGQSVDMLRATGSTDPVGTLRPLLTAALDNVLDHGDAALTGPVVRGDVRTVRDHLSVLDTAGAQVPDAAGVCAAYAVLAAATAVRAARSGRLLGADAAAIVELTVDRAADRHAPSRG